MKTSVLAWITCVLLLLGQLLFFFIVISPQLQKGQATQYTTSICGLANDDRNYNNYQLLQKLTDLQSDDHEGHQNNHIDQLVVTPLDQQGTFCVVVVYSSEK